MTNSQRIQRIIDEYNQQVASVEQMLIKLNAAEFVLKMEHIKVMSGCRTQKNNKKSAIIWGGVNVIPLTLGLITLNPFSICLSGGLVVFEAVLGIRAHIKGKKLDEQQKKLQTAIGRTSAYVLHLESQRSFLQDRIYDLEEALEKARAKGQEPSDQLVLEALHGKTMLLIEAGEEEKFRTPELDEKIEEIEHRYDEYNDDACGIEVE